MVGKKLSGTSIPGSVFLIGLLIVAAIDIYYIHMDWGPFNKPEMIRSVTLHQEYYTMDNALGLAKLYLATGLRYSVYQAMYDNGYRGGHSEIPENNLGYAPWYDNKDTYPNEQELLDNLKPPVLANMSKYTESDYVFLDDYAVKLPGYAGLETEKTQEGEVLVKASADRNLFISRTMQNLDKIELEKNGDLEEGFGKGYLELYQKALGILGEVKGKFTEIKGLLDKVKGGSLTREQEGSRPQITGEEVLLEALKKVGINAVSEEDGVTGLGVMLEGILNKLADRTGETVVQFEVLKDGDEKTLSLKEPVCTEQESQRTEGEKTFYKVTKTCAFTYNYDFAVKARATDNSGKRYPVFDSRDDEVSFEPLSIVFAARECNLEQCLKI